MSKRYYNNTPWKGPNLDLMNRTFCQAFCGNRPGRTTIRDIFIMVLLLLCMLLFLLIAAIVIFPGITL